MIQVRINKFNLLYLSGLSLVWVPEVLSPRPFLELPNHTGSASLDTFWGFSVIVCLAEKRKTKRNARENWS